MNPKIMYAVPFEDSDDLFKDGAFILLAARGTAQYIEFISDDARKNIRRVRVTIEPIQERRRSASPTRAQH